MFVMAEPPRAETATHVMDLRTTLRVRAAKVDVVAGPDAGRSVRIDHPSFVIGSGTGADLRLSDASISRDHLHVSLEVGGVRIVDTGSKNGTWLGQVRIRDITLTSDAALDLGKTSLVIHVDPVDTELALSASAEFGEAIGVSAAMRHVFALLERAAASDVTVLLEGESGT